MGFGAEQGIAKAGFNWFMPFGFFFSLMMWLMVIIIIHASIASYTQKSWYPLIYETAGRVFSADEKIYQDVQLLRASPEKVVNMEKATTWDYLKYNGSRIWFFFDILSSLIFIFGMWFLFYKIFNLFNNDSAVWNGLFAFGVIVILQMIMGSVFLVMNMNENPEQLSRMELLKKIGIAITPFKGIASLGIYFEDIINVIVNGINTNIVSQLTNIPRQQPLPEKPIPTQIG